MILRVLSLVVLATPLAAQDLAFDCAGTAPEWTLTLSQTTASFDFQRQSDLQVMLVTPAQNAQWPVAVTLVGRGDSVILILEKDQCRDLQSTATHGATLLTQRGETPLLLTGCCTPNS